jgi:peptidyl-prolyl cis-trans isomerase C
MTDRYSRVLLAAALVTFVPSLSVRAEDAAADPLVVTVDGDPITLGDLDAAAAAAPPDARALPPEKLYPMVLEQLIDSRAVLAAARAGGLDKDPNIARQMRSVSDEVLVSAMLNKLIGPHIGDDAVKARYDRQFGGLPGIPEVHARHILAGDEKTAKKIIDELKKGEDFKALSKKYSKDDPNVAAQGGDLGFFKQAEMVPEFAAAAFRLKDKEISPAPVQTKLGWHVIQVLEHRTVPQTSFEQKKDEIRRQMIEEFAQREVSIAKSKVKVQFYNKDGSPVQTPGAAASEPAPEK